MPYSRITKTSHGRDAIKYALEGKGHDGSAGRNVEVGVVNMNLYGDYAEQMKTYWDKAIARHKTQILRIIISFAKEELDPSDENDRLKAQLIGQDFVKKYYPGRQAVVCVQIDGKSGLVHIHILINDVHMENFKGHTDEQGHYASVEKWADKVSAEYIENIRNPRKENEKTPDKITRTERAKRDAGKYVWKDSLKTRIRGAMEACTSEKSFVTELEKRGVSAVKRESKKYGTYFTYTLDKKYIPRGEKMPKNLSARSYNLGDDFGYEAMRRHVHEKTKEVTDGNTTYQRVYLEEEKVDMTPEERAALMQQVRGWRDEEAEEAVDNEKNDRGDEDQVMHEEVIREPIREEDTADYIPREEIISENMEAAEPVKSHTEAGIPEEEISVPEEKIPAVNQDDNEEVYTPVQEVPAVLPPEENEIQDEVVQTTPVTEQRAAERRPVRRPAPAGPLSLDAIIAARAKDKRGPRDDLLEDLLQTAHSKKEMDELDEDQETAQSSGGDTNAAERVRAKERQMEQRRQDMRQRLQDQQTKQVTDLRNKGGKIPENYQDLLWNSMNKKKEAGGEEYE